jgi:hypothetical protein
LRTTSGPMPAGSPIVTATIGLRAIDFREIEEKQIG